MWWKDVQRHPHRYRVEGALLFVALSFLVGQYQMLQKVWGYIGAKQQVIEQAGGVAELAKKVDALPSRFDDVTKRLDSMQKSIDDGPIRDQAISRRIDELEAWKSHRE